MSEKRPSLVQPHRVPMRRPDAAASAPAAKAEAFPPPLKIGKPGMTVMANPIPRASLDEEAKIAKPVEAMTDHELRVAFIKAQAAMTRKHERWDKATAAAARGIGTLMLFSLPVVAHLGLPIFSVDVIATYAVAFTERWRLPVPGMKKLGHGVAFWAAQCRRRGIDPAAIDTVAVRTEEFRRTAEAARERAEAAKKKAEAEMARRAKIKADKEAFYAEIANETDDLWLDRLCEEYRKGKPSGIDEERTLGRPLPEVDDKPLRPTPTFPSFPPSLRR